MLDGQQTELVACKPSTQPLMSYRSHYPYWILTNVVSARSAGRDHHAHVGKLKLRKM
jgi:hypothetical protein